LWGLLHDASEAYLGDVNSPLKSLLPDYREIEHRMMCVIAQKFGLEGTVIPGIVKRFDTAMLFNEVEAFLPKTDISKWNIEGFKIPNLILQPLMPHMAYAIYLDMFFWGCK
jgi:uncharacterized protein